MSVWKSVGQQLSGLAKHVAKTAGDVPGEILEGVTGQTPTNQTQQQNEAMQALEQGGQTATQQGMQGDDANNPKGFRTKEDFDKYQTLSGKKDSLELSQIRHKLQSEWGLDGSLESGMQQARTEYEEKEKQRKQAEEQKKEEEKMMELEVKKKEDEDMAVKAAREASSAENKAWGAG